VLRLPLAVAACALLVVATACSDDDGSSGSSDSGSGSGSGSDAGSESSAEAGECSPAREAPADADAEGAPAVAETGQAPADAGQAQTFTFDGQERSYLLYLPDDYDGTTAHPLVLAFHGHGGSKEVAAAASQLGEQGTERGYIVVFPDALGAVKAWNFAGDPNQADDFGFIDALVGDLSERLCIDEARIYAAGHSNGSAFTGFLACQPSYRFAAVVMVSAFIPSTCPVDKASPAVMAIHGTADPGVPYDGGSVAGGPVQIPGVLSTLDQYRDHYSCAPTPIEDSPHPGVTRKTYKNCIHNTEATLITITNGGHEWPLQKFPATSAILDFFDTHQKP
jgi:polyhydroxybutyrate depolymerase